jgi:hypothetical protein
MRISISGSGAAWTAIGTTKTEPNKPANKGDANRPKAEWINAFIAAGSPPVTGSVPAVAANKAYAKQNYKYY